MSAPLSAPTCTCRGRVLSPPLRATPRAARSLCDRPAAECGMHLAGTAAACWPVVSPASLTRGTARRPAAAKPQTRVSWDALHCYRLAHPSKVFARHLLTANLWSLRHFASATPDFFSFLRLRELVGTSVRYSRRREKSFRVPSAPRPAPRPCPALAAAPPALSGARLMGPC